jgi:4-alpha-glucanotransferase
VIIPLQDILGLGSEGRMNTPGHASGNWQWRFTLNSVDAATRERLKNLTEIYGRVSKDAVNHVKLE